jgi:hypothetical protein
MKRKEWMDDYGGTLLAMLLFVLVFVLAWPVAVTEALDRDKCVDGHGGPKKCTACGCGGEVDKMKSDPKEPGGNEKYPNLKCRQACSPQCCGCTQEKKSSRNPFLKPKGPK